MYLHSVTLCVRVLRKGFAVLISRFLSEVMRPRTRSSAPSILTALKELNIFEVGFRRTCMAANQACCRGPAIFATFNVNPAQAIFALSEATRFNYLRNVLTDNQSDHREARKSNLTLQQPGRKNSLNDASPKFVHMDRTSHNTLHICYHKCHCLRLRIRIRA